MNATSIHKSTIDSREAAISALKIMMDGIDNRGYVYQFPKGHWGWASFRSPIGQSLGVSDYVYPDHGIKATQFALVTW